MNYEYQWVISNFIEKNKKKIIPVKANTFLFSDVPTIKKGKYKGCLGTAGLVLCMVKK
jgi:hypothetical protein